MRLSKCIRTFPLCSVISNTEKIMSQSSELVISSYRFLFNRLETRRSTKDQGETPFQSFLKNTLELLDSRFTFECIIDGNEPINVIWIKDQTIISSLTHDIQYERGLASLTLADVQREDSAYYTCRASNTAGTVESSAYLVVKGRRMIKLGFFIERNACPLIPQGPSDSEMRQRLAVTNGD